MTPRAVKQPEPFLQETLKVGDSHSPQSKSPPNVFGHVDGVPANDDIECPTSGKTIIRVVTKKRQFTQTRFPARRSAAVPISAIGVLLPATKRQAGSHLRDDLSRIRFDLKTHETAKRGFLPVLYCSVFLATRITSSSVVMLRITFWMPSS